jgi:hypothetical protein
MMFFCWHVMQCLCQNLKRQQGSQNGAGASTESHKKGCKMGHYASHQIKTENLTFNTFKTI